MLSNSTASSTRGILWLDCLGGLFVGTCVLLFAAQISSWEALPIHVVIFMGAVNLGYGMYSLFVATRRDRSMAFVKILAIANMAWLLVCILVTVIWWSQINLLGLTHVLGEGIYVAALGLTEWKMRTQLAVS